MKFSKSYEPGLTEPDIYGLWENSGVFEPSGKGKPYAIVMPPPNANGNLHIGHGLFAALQDILIRYHRMQGEDTIWIPGADHAGFETWVVYEKTLEEIGKSRFDFSRETLYGQVWNFVAEQRGNMELQLRALGSSCSWKDLVFTLDQKVVDTVYDTFKKMWDDGLIYRGKRLVNFCTKHQTAFADIEVAYKEEKTPLYYMKYGPFELATTRPETKFGDTGVAVNPADERYQEWVGKTITVEGVNGSFKVKVVADEMVDMNFGTGVVKITPAHDFNDWEVAERHNLPVVQVIDTNGRMTAAAGRFEGMSVLEARKAVVEAMQEMGIITKIDEDYVTKVPRCYKCGTVIEPMLKEQWFIKVQPLAEKAIEVIEKGEIRFVPASKKGVLVQYFKNLKDWNISRQIPWGIPIPAFRRAEEQAAPSNDGLDTETAAENVGFLDSIEGPGKSDSGEWVFDTRVHEEQIEVNDTTYTRDEDTFDTWFSSGQWPFIVTDYLQKGDLARFYPNSVMETAGDILFAWVARMIMMGVYVTGKAPFKDVYLHGLVLDEKGQKMSKSKGNVINPMEIVGEYGSDAFRLGIVASRSAGQNQAFARNKVVAGRNLCNKLWNIARLTQEMVDNNPEAEIAGDISAQWIFRELGECQKRLKKLMKDYRFAEAAEDVYQTVWTKYADWFIEAQKLQKNIPALKKALEESLKLMHPFAPFVTETIWQTLSWTEGILAGEVWNKPEEYAAELADDFDRVQALVSEARLAVNELPEKKKYKLLYMSDELIEKNQELIKFLVRLPEVEKIEEARGMRLASAGCEAWLDVPAEVLAEHKVNLQIRLDEITVEKDRLAARLTNENYVKKAPAELVEETRRGLAEKEQQAAKLKTELEAI